MTPRRVLQLLRQPRYLAQRIAYKWYELRHPDEPWIAQGAVRFCEGRLTGDMRGLEWGSGRSTLWFARRLGHLTSIEYDEAWYGRIRDRLTEFRNVDYRYVPVDHPLHEATRPHYDPLPRYVAVAGELADGSLDFVVVDGHYRQACILAVLPKLRAGGLLLVDNTDRLPLSEWGVPSDWPVLHQSRNVMTQTTIWQKPGR